MRLFLLDAFFQAIFQRQGHRMHFDRGTFGPSLTRTRCARRQAHLCKPQPTNWLSLPAFDAFRTASGHRRTPQEGAVQSCRFVLPFRFFSFLHGEKSKDSLSSWQEWGQLCVALSGESRTARMPQGQSLQSIEAPPSARISPRCAAGPPGRRRREGSLCRLRSKRRESDFNRALIHRKHITADCCNHRPKKKTHGFF